MVRSNLYVIEVSFGFGCIFQYTVNVVQFSLGLSVSRSTSSIAQAASNSVTFDTFLMSQSSVSASLYHKPHYDNMILLKLFRLASYCPETWKV